MKSFFLRSKYSVFSVLVGGALIVAFQNCSNVGSPAKFESELTNKKNIASDATGGQPYDGKVYVLLGAACPDGQSVISRVVLKNETLGQLTRDSCQDLNVPMTLESKDFQLDPTDINKFVFRGTTWPSENLVNLAAINDVDGYGYWLRQNFGTPGDTLSALTQSTVRLFENGVELGPAHSSNTEIRTLGGGRFYHWDYNGATMQAMFLSSSDNSDPRSNGRKYTYVIGP